MGPSSPVGHRSNLHLPHWRHPGRDLFLASCHEATEVGSSTITSRPPLSTCIPLLLESTSVSLPRSRRPSAHVICCDVALDRPLRAGSRALQGFRWGTLRSVRMCVCLFVRFFVLVVDGGGYVWFGVVLCDVEADRCLWTLSSWGFRSSEAVLSEWFVFVVVKGEHCVRFVRFAVGFGVKEQDF